MTSQHFSCLIKKYINGDKKGFDKIFEEFYHKLVGAAYLILHDKHESQNVASDMFLRILINPITFMNLKNPSTYLFVSTQNLAKNILHKQRSTFDKQAIIVEDFSKEADARIDFYRLIETNFNQIEQDMLIMRCVMDLTYAEIGKRLGVPLGTIKTKFKRFKIKLNDKIR